MFGVILLSPFFAGTTFGQLTCVVQSSACSGTTPNEIMRLSDTDNAHAQTSASYSQRVCCSEAKAASPTVAETVLNLSASSNAHVENAGLTNYSTFVGIEGVVCAVDSACTAPAICVVSLSSTSTNAHVGNYSAYSNKVCCELACTQTNAGIEACDGVDNNCNGQVDELVADIITGTNVGVCQQGIQECQGLAGFVITQAEISPSTETCNSLDDDCDGTSDDGIANIVTGSNVGVCQEQIEQCISGSFVITQTAIGPSAEVCDGFDNDCNGTANDGESVTGNAQIDQADCCVDSGVPLTFSGGNHGRYVSCVAHASKDLVKSDGITQSERKPIIRSAAKSDVGK